MSDADPEDDETLENPEPEADSVAEANVGLNAEAENDEVLLVRNDDSVRRNVQVLAQDDANGATGSSDDLPGNGNESNQGTSTLNQVQNEEVQLTPGSENPEGFSLGEDQAEGQVPCNFGNNDFMTEGDQNLLRNGNPAGGEGDSLPVNDLSESGQNFQNLDNLAAEDEQFYHEACVGADSSVSLEAEGDVVIRDCNVAEEAEGAVGVSVEEQEVTSHRTESSCELDEFSSQQDAAGSQSATGHERDVSSVSENCEAEGASASGEGESLEPESDSVKNNSDSHASRELEPTESDEEIKLGEQPDSAENNMVSENGQAHLPVNNSEHASGTVNEASNAGNLEVNERSENSGCADRNVPEDEISAVAAVKPESFQPECDQSETKDLQASPSFNKADSSENDHVESGARDINNEGSKSDRQTENNRGHPNQIQSNCDNNASEADNSISSVNENVEETKVEGTETIPAFTKESGAIPKNRTKMSEPPSHSRPAETAQGKQSDAKSYHRPKEGTDSEDELLSELDATLQSNSIETGANNGPSQDSEQTVKDSDKPVSCDQCLRNNLRCSFKEHCPEKGGNENIPGMKELKKQLHQAKQMLLDRECEISRLKEDAKDDKSLCETLLLERDTNAKELERLKTQNSDDLYIPQIKELEYTIAQQTNEIRGLKDKLSSHDSAAKRAIATLQHEMKARVDQVMKQADEANREKDTMVVKFAQAEHKNLELKKQAERAENKLKEMEKERDAFLVKMRALKDHRSKIAADLEARTAEVSNLHRDLDKSKESLSSIDVRVKWAQNKLKAELESHKETKQQLEKMTGKLKEAKEETQQIRHDCQAIIKTYQESEEVKSNSLDKELKLKQSELLEREVQQTNFELAHVKTQRELEQVKGELRESQAKLSALTEKLSSVEAENEQSSLTGTRYAEIIQRQKTEIQELRERVESLVQFKTDFTSAQELIKTLDTEIAELKITNKELVADMDSCRRRETDKLELTAKLSRKNAELQSENTNLSNRVLNLTGELQAAKMENQEYETKLKDLSDSLEKEQKLRHDETEIMNTKLAGKCKAVEDLTRKVEDEKDEIKTLKRKHANNIKDLTRQLQQVRRKLESYEASTNGDKDTISLGSRTSSTGSLNTVNIADQTTTQVVQPNVTGQQNSVHQRNPSPEREYPVITEQVEVDKQTLIERIVKLQRALARKNEKIEFMEDHITQLVDEIQKKNKIIQSYVLKEDSGTMTTDFRDRAKAEISRKHSIMGSVYSSHNNDGTMTLDLSLEINRKLQAVLEDTLLKNMTLKESLDTLGQEIARLSQENRRLQLLMQGKPRSKNQPTSR